MRAAREQSRTRTACGFDCGGNEGGRGSESPALGPQPPGCSRDEYPSRPWHAGVGFDEIVRPVARATTKLCREEGGKAAETPEFAASSLPIQRTLMSLGGSLVLYAPGERRNPAEPPRPDRQDGSPEQTGRRISPVQSGCEESEDREAGEHDRHDQRADGDGLPAPRRHLDEFPEQRIPNRIHSSRLEAGLSWILSLRGNEPASTARGDVDEGPLLLAEESRASAPDNKVMTRWSNSPTRASMI